MTFGMVYACCVAFFLFAIVHWDLCVWIGCFMWFSIIHFILLVTNRRLVVAVTVYCGQPPHHIFWRLTVIYHHYSSQLCSAIYTLFDLCKRQSNKKLERKIQPSLASTIHPIQCCLHEESKWNWNVWVRHASKYTDWFLLCVCLSFSHSDCFNNCSKRVPNTEHM